jgi:hypothetical protein
VAVKRILPVVLTTVLGCGLLEQASRTHIHLEVTGGPHAGRYAVQTERTACARDLLGRGSLAIRYTDLDSNAALASLQLMIESDTAFYLGLAFDGFRPTDSELEIETRRGRRPRGAGKVTLNRVSATTVLDVVGRTAGGLPLTARVLCAADDSSS